MVMVFYEPVNSFSIKLHWRRTLVHRINREQKIKTHEFIT
jgi:hypothetical protein